MSEVIFVVEDDSEGGFTAKALGYSIYTEADTWEELKNNIQDAVVCHFDDDKKPSIIRIHLVRDELLVV